MPRFHRWKMKSRRLSVRIFYHVWKRCVKLTLYHVKMFSAWTSHSHPLKFHPLSRTGKNFNRKRASQKLGNDGFIRVDHNIGNNGNKGKYLKRKTIFEQREKSGVTRILVLKGLMKILGLTKNVGIDGNIKISGLVGLIAVSKIPQMSEIFQILKIDLRSTSW